MTEANSETLVVETREVAALKIVNRYVGWSAGAGFIPMPLLDLAAITGVQLKMLSALGELYGVPLNRNAAKGGIGALVGGVLPFAAAPPVASLMKLVPVVGTLLGAVTLPALASAATYALGKVFIQHFESGGTFLDLDPEKVQAYFKEQFENKRAADAPELKKNAKAAV